MADSEKDFAGKGGFIWWFGYVEDRMDPLKLGRLKVRCVGWDADNKMEVTSDSLPWAQVAYPMNNPTPYPPREGDMVVGFFADGETAQQRIVFGVFPAIPMKEANSQEAYSDPRESSLSGAPRPPASKVYKTDGSGIEVTEKEKASPYPNYLDEPTTSRLARNDSDTMDKTFIKERKTNVVKEVPTVNGTWAEPETLYAAKYPYNNVLETEAGHIVEVDDTFGAERIHIAHRNGSFIEMFPKGDRVEKITKDKYTIVMKDDHLYVMGDCKITVQGNAEVYIKKDAFIKVDKNVDMKVGENVTADVGGDVSAKVGGSVTAEVGGSMTAKVGGSFNMDIGGSCGIKSGGNMTFTAPKISLN